MCCAAENGGERDRPGCHECYRSASDRSEQQEVETEIEKAVSADTLDRLQLDAAKLLEEYETAKPDGTEEEAAKLNEAYERMLAEINAMLG